MSESYLINELVVNYAKKREEFIIANNLNNNIYNQKYTKKLMEIDKDFKIIIEQYPNKEQVINKTLEFFSTINDKVDIHVFTYWCYVSLLYPSVLFIPQFVKLLKLDNELLRTKIIEALSYMPQEGVKQIIPELIIQVMNEHHGWGEHTINGIIDIIADNEELNSDSFVLSEGIYSLIPEVRERCKYWADIYADFD